MKTILETARLRLRELVLNDVHFLAEMLAATFNVNAMLWKTAPAATELEMVVLDWLRQMIGLPETFEGVIHDTASTATLCALICARERTTQFAQRGGYAKMPP